MAGSETRVGEARPGGRAARVRTAVLTATSDLLDEVGYDQLTVDEVARRAGVHKTTVYRRWPSKPELVLDAVTVHSEVNVPIPDTGTLEGDLRGLARAVAANIGSEGGALRARSIVAASAGSDELASRMQTFWARRMIAAAPIVERAVARGELDPTVDPVMVIHAVAGPIWLRLLMTGDPIGEGFADEVAALVAAGARALTPPPT